MGNCWRYHSKPYTHIEVLVEMIQNQYHSKNDIYEKSRYGEISATNARLWPPELDASEHTMLAEFSLQGKS